MENKRLIISVGSPIAGDNVDSVFGRTGVIVAENGDYTTSLVTESADKKYVTDAEKTVLSNTSGTNTGDETTSTIQTKRPLKDVNGESLEGTGNIDFNTEDITNNDLTEFPTEATQYDINRSLKASLPSLSLSLPTQIEAVVGDTIQLFFQAMVSTPNYDNFHFVGQYSQISEAKSTPRYLEITPTTTGIQSITIYVLGDKNNIIDQKTTTLIVKDSVDEPLKQVDFWNVGDSFINTPTSTNELIRRLTGTGGTPAGDEYGNIDVHRIGNSGKQWNWYVSDEDSPFVFSGVLDFEQYRLNQGLNVPKMMQISLTWNGVGDKKTDAEWDIWDDDVYTFLDTLRTQFPNIDVVLVSPSMPSTLGGESVVNGARGLLYYGDEYQLKVNCLRMAQIYERIKQETGYEYVSHIQSALQVDSLYNVGYNDTNVNTRNTTLQERIGNNDVHPTTEGYYQIADAQYRKFIGDYCQGGDVKGLNLTLADKDWIDLPQTLDFNSGDWIEFEVATDNSLGDRKILGYDGNNVGDIFWIGPTYVFLRFSDNTVASLTGAIDTSTNTKIKVIKESGDFVVYVNGVEYGRHTTASNLLINQINKRGTLTTGFSDMIIKSYSLSGDFVDCQEGTGTSLNSYLNNVSTINTDKTDPNTVWINL